MNLTIKIFLLCPVPDNQKPINEYLSLQSSTITNWIQDSSIVYRAKIRQLYSLIFFFFFAFFFLSNLSNLTNLHFDITQLPKFVVNLFLLTNLSCLLLFVLIFIQWRQLEKRLKDSRIFYEEGSWYDGQIWEKSFFILKNDRLLVLQLIEPFLKRFLLTINRFSYTTIFQFFLLFLLNSLWNL